MGDLYILDGDLFKAFDSINHNIAIKRLRKRGLKMITIAAIIREVRRAQSIVRAGGMTTEGIARLRSLTQDGPDAPKFSNAIFD